jgi:hypothetical protein
MKITWRFCEDYVGIIWGYERLRAHLCTPRSYGPIAYRAAAVRPQFERLEPDPFSRVNRRTLCGTPR